MKTQIEQKKILGVGYVNPSEIERLEGESNYTFIYLKNGHKFIVATTLNKVMKALEPHINLMRIHKSYAINQSYIKNVENYWVLLTSGSEVKISRRRYGSFLQDFSGGFNAA